MLLELALLKVWQNPEVPSSPMPSAEACEARRQCRMRRIKCCSLGMPFRMPHLVKKAKRSVQLEVGESKKRVLELLVWSGSNTPVIQGRHIRAQSESESAASSPGVVPVGPCMCCLSFPSRRRRPGYRCPHTCIVTMPRERPHLGHSIVSPL